MLVLELQRGWDDERLLIELKRKYNSLRTIWRRLFSFKSVRAITMVPSMIETYGIIPQRIMELPSDAQGLRFRHYFRHPDKLRGREHFLISLTADRNLGVMLLEQWSATRITFWVILAVLSTLVLAIVYTCLTHDVSTAFTIAGYMAAALSVLGILIGVLSFIKFR
ncbi:hypothetical protein JAAARDRAFT_72560 [Jaapia argillacea MUCL 33604]|uniref:Uncharacterized protein n=1 Tax=Jaapia argillacea MUCL 33604 TaxID=933084 RepID=A0A067PQP8_9AGAM|nr:hypothetical protein JAAARDRAFT_72560 [Jaapia argillacea MUCL 33604]